MSDWWDTSSTNFGSGRVGELSRGLWAKWRKKKFNKKPVMTPITTRHLVEYAFKNLSQKDGETADICALFDVCDPSVGYDENVAILDESIRAVKGIDRMDEEMLKDNAEWQKEFKEKEASEQEKRDSITLMQEKLEKYKLKSKKYELIVKRLQDKNFELENNTKSLLEEQRKKFLEAQSAFAGTQLQSKVTVKFTARCLRFQSLIDNQYYGPFSEDQLAELFEVDAKQLQAKKLLKIITSPVSPVLCEENEIHGFFDSIGEAWITGDDVLLERNLKKIRDAKLVFVA